MLLERFHLTPSDLATGVKAAMRRPCTEADAYLGVLEKAGGVSGSKALLGKLKEGWRPSLDDLLDAGLNEAALRWMPEGVAELEIVGQPVKISTHRIASVLYALKEMDEPERHIEEWLKGIVRLQSVIPARVCEVTKIERE